jgi:putative nucleotidyltransferase with HDIG domain
VCLAFALLYKEAAQATDPRSVEGDEAVQKASVLEAVPDRPRVLVVDDEELFAETVADLLVQSGYEATSVTDPAEALKRAAGGGYDAALVDLVMPRMSGLDLIERLHEVSPYTQVAIVTGHANMETAVSSLQRGVYDYLPKKDVTAVALEGMVRGAVERARLARGQAEAQERVRESNRLLEALRKVGAQALRSPNPARLLDEVASIAKEVAEAASARVLLFTRTHSEEGLLVSSGGGDAAEAIWGSRLGPEDGLAAITALTGKCFQLDRADDHPRYSHKTDEMPKAQLGFLCVPVRYQSVQGALLVGGWRQKPFTTKTLDALQQLGQQAAVHLETLSAHERSANFFTHTCDLLVSILDAVDVHAPGHSRATAAYADMITRRLGLVDAERRNIHFAALLHDIGKVKMDLDLVREDGRYRDDARERMKQHPVVAVEMLKPITIWADMLPIIHAHHERWDGKGYPTGLAGEDIPLGARVVAVAEAFDAMTRSKPYGVQRSPEEALLELECHAGTQFDPLIVRLFASEYRKRQAA